MIEVIFRLAALALNQNRIFLLFVLIIYNSVFETLKFSIIPGGYKVHEKVQKIMGS